MRDKQDTQIVYFSAACQTAGSLRVCLKETFNLKTGCQMEVCSRAQDQYGKGSLTESHVLDRGYKKTAVVTGSKRVV